MHILFKVSGEIFDSLTDEKIEIHEGNPLPTISLKLGGYYIFGP